MGVGLVALAYFQCLFFSKYHVMCVLFPESLEVIEWDSAKTAVPVGRTEHLNTTNRFNGQN